MKGEAMKCHRCGESITLYVAGRDYCQPCVRDLARIAQQDAARKVVQFSRPKDLTAA